MTSEPLASRPVTVTGVTVEPVTEAGTTVEPVKEASTTVEPFGAETIDVEAVDAASIDAETVDAESIATESIATESIATAPDEVEAAGTEPVDEPEPAPVTATPALERARRAADAHVRAADQVAAFVHGIIDDVPDSTLVAEYAALLRREEAARDAREDAVAALGLSVPSEGIGVRAPAAGS